MPGFCKCFYVEGGHEADKLLHSHSGSLQDLLAILEPSSRATDIFLLRL